MLLEPSFSKLKLLLRILIWFASSFGHASELLSRRSVVVGWVVSVGVAMMFVGGSHALSPEHHFGDVGCQLRVGFYCPVDVACCGNELELGSGSEADQFRSGLYGVMRNPARFPDDKKFVVTCYRGSLCENFLHLPQVAFRVAGVQRLRGRVQVGHWQYSIQWVRRCTF